MNAAKWMRIWRADDDRRSRIEEVLSSLKGLAISSCPRQALDMVMFELGDRIITTDYKGHSVEVGKYALHITCPWRLVDQATIIVGSDDMCIPPGEQRGCNEPHSAGPSRFGQRATLWFEQYNGRGPIVASVRADVFGGFNLGLSQDQALEVFPADSFTDDERWRLFATDDQRNFVVRGHGIDEDNWTC